MKCIIAVVLLAAAASAAFVASPVRATQRLGSAGKPLSLRLSSPESDTLAFLEGFALGLAEDFGNITECRNDSITFVEEFDQAFTLIKKGIDHASINDIVQGLIEFANGIDEVAKALQDCGDAQVVADIANLAKYLKGGPAGIIQLIAKEVLQYFNDQKTLGYDYRQAIKAWDATPRDYRTAGFYAGEITAIFLAIN